MKKLFKHKDVIYILKNTPYKFIKSFVIIISNFILTWYIANYYPETFLGQYVFITSTMGLLIIFSLPGVKSAIVESVSKGQEAAYVYGTRLAFKYSIIGSLVLLSVAFFYRFYTHDYLYFWAFWPFLDYD